MLSLATCLRLTRDRLWMVLSPSTFTPSNPAKCPIPPFRPCSISHHALLSVVCFWADISQTLPLRPVTSSASRKSEGSCSSCESNPTHLCVLDSGEGIALGGGARGCGVPTLTSFSLSDHATSSFSTHGHGLWFKFLWKENNLSGKPAGSRCLYFLSSKQMQRGSGTMWRKRWVLKRKALLTNDEWRFVCVCLSINRQRLLCSPIRQGIIIHLKHQGQTNWLVAFPSGGPMTLTICPSLPAKLLLPQQMTSWGI